MSGRSDRNGSLSTRFIDAILVALLIVTAWRLFDVSRSDGLGTTAVSNSRALRQGDVLRLPGIEWSASRNVVLVLSSTCPASIANLPFYRRLISEAHPGMGLFVVTLEPTDVVAEWLKRGGINLPNIHHVDDPSSFGLTLTPMVVLTDGDGRVTDLMITRLDERDQERTLTRIRDSAAPALDNSLRVREILVDDLDTSSRPLQMIDVRSRERFRSGHHPMARNIPIDELESRAVIELEIEAPVVVDCLQPGGGICRSAAWTLVWAGFSDVSVLIR
jgi:rhodanese-related sulfurtransferase